jgi:hypothetical protein
MKTRCARPHPSPQRDRSSRSPLCRDDVPVTLRALARQVRSCPPASQSSAAQPATRTQLHLFSGQSIRNVACVSGNLATGASAAAEISSARTHPRMTCTRRGRAASPISDLNPLWIAFNAQIVLQSERYRRAPRPRAPACVTTCGACCSARLQRAASGACQRLLPGLPQGGHGNGRSHREDRHPAALSQHHRPGLQGAQQPRGGAERWLPALTQRRRRSNPSGARMTSPLSTPASPWSSTRPPMRSPPRASASAAWVGGAARTAALPLTADAAAPARPHPRDCSSHPALPGESGGPLCCWRALTARRADRQAVDA